MIKDENAVSLYRFTEKRWADRFIAGEISFSCAGKFIYQNKITGNEAQGDKLEAVFARLEKDDERIVRAKELLGKDLEIIKDEETDGKLVYLRRRSAKLKPIFCVYAYTAGDMIEDNENEIKGTGWQYLKHSFDEQMYGGFSETYKFVNVMDEKAMFTQLQINAKSFTDRVKDALMPRQKPFRMERVNYDEFRKETFFIEPTNEYTELFYKRFEYKYQHEARIVLTGEKFNTINERLNLQVRPFILGEDIEMVHQPIDVKYYVDVELAK